MAKKEWTEEEVRDILMDVRTTGCGGFPRIVSDEQWVAANVKEIELLGPKVYLERLLAKLHKDF